MLWIWLLTAVSGFAVWKVASWFLESLTMRSRGWRLFMCCMFACAVTPTLLPNIFPHQDSLLILPALFVLVFIIGSPEFALVYGVLPLGIVTGVSYRVWSKLIEKVEVIEEGERDQAQ
jgi:hypothetical protein